MTTIIYIFALIFGLLQFILFFKIWRATNDIANIRELLRASMHKSETSKSPSEDEEELKMSSLVRHLESGKQMRIGAIKDGKYACFSNQGTFLEGVYSREELEPFK